MQSYRTHGKWILAGEHTVLRGGQALVFPVESRYLDFQYVPQKKLSLRIENANKDLELAFWGVLEKALQKLDLTREQVAGEIKLTSNIPVGAGMGASATLCVSLAKWLSDLGFLGEARKYEFAKDLENLFHGQSSGVDVAVALKEKPLVFQKSAGFSEFDPIWKPHFYLSYCGKRGVTADCIDRVTTLFEKDSSEGERIDKKMKSSVELAKTALVDRKNQDQLIEAIEMASQCFHDWGLVSRQLDQHMAELKNSGALAAKPTGSGDGGFVLSLWDKPVENSKDLIKA